MNPLPNLSYFFKPFPFSTDPGRVQLYLEITITQSPEIGCQSITDIAKTIRPLNIYYNKTHLDTLSCDDIVDYYNYVSSTTIRKLEKWVTVEKSPDSHTYTYTLPMPRTYKL